MGKIARRRWYNRLALDCAFVQTTERMGFGTRRRGDSQLLVVSAEQALLLRLDRARDSVAAGLRVGD